jgi:arginine decarboxylase
LWQSIYTKLLNAFSTHGVGLVVIPEEFFVTSGKATSPVSELNAFDLSLKNAGIAQCNLVAVSSILPPQCKERRWRKLPAGAITHAVVARFDGGEGTTIGAGIAWAWERKGEYGIVAEAHGHMDRKALEETLARRIREMAEIRGIETGKAEFRIEVLRVPEGNYGCVLAALVYCSAANGNSAV